MRRIPIGWLLFGPSAIWGVLAAVSVMWTGVRAANQPPPDRRRSEPVGSEACADCHPAEYRTWHRSYHRTMTQPARGPAVQAPFAGESLDYLGFRATLTRTADGVPHVRVEADPRGAGDPIVDTDVVYTIGSHRYQQYAARIDRGGGPDEIWRLPVAWHTGEGRWIHLNGAFVEPEGRPGVAADYLRHLSRWNDNCIFCHNTQPVPGRDAAGRFRSEVAELGIACEACHGPASAHLAQHRNPARRVIAGTLLGRGHDGTVAHPGRLRPVEESGVCGRCHGQRIASDVDAVLRDGDGFLPGEDLANASRPIFRESTLAGQPGRPFVARFWPDGTPRLSAYEYQGLLLSPCYTGESDGLGCNGCHDMHGEDPDGQLRARGRGTAACVGCHPASTLSGTRDAGGHGGHGATANCMDCHMPRITYGLLEGMISHRITIPDPGRWVGRDDQPDACTQCHVDRSRGWAAQGMEKLGLHGTEPGPADPSEDWASRVGLDLLGGDPLQRNLAAHALARPGATGEPRERMAWLVDALEDEYPSVRWFGWRAIRTLAQDVGDHTVLDLCADFDYLGDPADRLAVVDELRRHLPRGGRPVDEVHRRDQVTARRERVAIWIGE